MSGLSEVIDAFLDETEAGTKYRAQYKARKRAQRDAIRAEIRDNHRDPDTPPIRILTTEALVSFLTTLTRERTMLLIPATKPLPAFLSLLCPSASNLQLYSKRWWKDGTVSILMGNHKFRYLFAYRQQWQASKLGDAFAKTSQIAMAAANLRMEAMDFGGMGKI
ncbi:hypothetical protein BGX38DRAFT_1271402 [Terfezia claveryi]|nr:hypothetical protein BGX38DRAFT_1271402 [Terfezia claveryi]